MGVSEDLAWWREVRGDNAIDVATLHEVLARLQAWKTQHDDDRARQFIPFFKMVWDGIFGDEDEAVVTAITEIEAVIAARP